MANVKSVSPNTPPETMQRNCSVLLVCSILLVVSVISVLYDDALLTALQRIHHPYLDSLFWLVTQFAVIIALFFCGGSILLWKKKKEWIIPLWITGIIAGALSLAIKAIVERPRPLGEASFLWFPDYSFPSTHATVAVSAVPILWHFFPKLRWILVTLACAVVISRVYLGVHYASDVLFGSLLGYSVGWGVLSLWNGYLHQ